MAIKTALFYARRDDKLRVQLEEHLKPAIREGVIDLWYDRDINLGTEFDLVIRDKLDNSELILLLVSPSFMASDYCQSIELTRALELHEANRAKVVPILLRPSDWKTRLGKLQALPRDGKPISKQSNRDDAWLKIVLELRQLAENLAILRA